MSDHSLGGTPGVYVVEAKLYYASACNFSRPRASGIVCIRVCIYNVWQFLNTELLYQAGLALYVTAESLGHYPIFVFWFGHCPTYLYSGKLDVRSVLCEVVSSCSNGSVLCSFIADHTLDNGLLYA